MSEPSGRGDGAPLLTIVFFVVGSLFNLLALVLLLANIVGITRAWLTGEPAALGWEQLAPLGAFLAGILCYVIAHTLD